MNKDLEKFIKSSTYQVIEGVFVYTKVKSVPGGKNHFMVSIDADEITVVTKLENLSELDLIERNKDNYVLIALNVSVPFYSVGFLATVSGAVANAGLNILIISTYSKDYIMVKYDSINVAQNELEKLGFKVHPKK